MFLKYKCLIILLLFLTGNMMTEAQELIAPTDTVTAVVGDTVVPAGQDSVLALDSVPKKQTGLDAPVSYQAKDSIIMTGANWAYLFGESDVKYQQIELQSEKIEMNMDSSLVYALSVSTRSGRNSAILFSKMVTNSMNPRRCAIISVRKKDTLRM